MSGAGVRGPLSAEEAVTVQITNILGAKGDQVETVVASATVREAVARLKDRSIGALVVSEDGRSIDGIVSERDIVRQLGTAGLDLLDAPVSRIMSHPVHTCSPEDSPESVMATMTNHRVRHVPVVRDGAICGIVSIGDVVKSRIESLEADHKILVEYITAR